MTYHTPKRYFQTLNTHVGVGPILVESYYETSIKWVTQKPGGGQCCFTFSAVPSNSRPNLGTYNEKAIFLSSYSK